MEIHAPHHPILTLKEALVHLTIVTVGILIALSLEGAREWHEHRTLVAETRENLNREIEVNRTELAGYTAGITSMQQQLTHAREIVRTVLDKKPLQHPSIELVYHGAELQSASHTTAELTGAFAFMGRDEIVAYARVYDRQVIFERIQDRVYSDYVGAIAGTNLIADDSGTASTRELEDWKHALDVAWSSAEMAKQIAAALSDEYQKALAHQGS